MKKFYFMLLILVPLFLFSSVISISNAKALSDGKDVIVRGIVTVEPGPFDVNIIFIQDESGGINVYLRGGHFEGIDRGDLVEISGYMWTHRLNRELVIDADKEKYYIKVLSKNNTLPQPKKISTKDINNEEYQGLFVEVEGDVVKIEQSDPRKVYIDDGSGNGMVFIRENTGILTSYFRVGMHLKVKGVLGRYQSFFELWPRSMDDIEAGDVFPPEVKSVFLKDDKVYIVFNEPVSEKSVLDNKTIRIAGRSIKRHTMYFDNRVVILELDKKIDSTVKIMIRFVKDMNENQMGSIIASINPEKDVFTKRVLFDEGHGQQAGNADWVIYGAYSDFAEALKNELGMYVESTKENLTYELLSLYKVFIIPEPNRPFKAEEIDAILKFVENGGGLFLIADHGGSDRNGNGWDSPRIFNEFVENFGFKFTGDSIEEEPLEYVYEHEITEGINSVGAWAGSTIQVLRDDVKILISDRNKKPYLVLSSYGKGFVVAIGDSSPFDDGTGDKNDILHDGWSYGDDAKLAVNIVKFLSSH
jgi:hypothetical protein